MYRFQESGRYSLTVTVSNHHGVVTETIYLVSWHCNTHNTLLICCMRTVFSILSFANLTYFPAEVHLILRSLDNERARRSNLFHCRYYGDLFTDVVIEEFVWHWYFPCIGGTAQVQIVFDCPFLCTCSPIFQIVNGSFVFFRPSWTQKSGIHLLFFIKVPLLSPHLHLRLRSHILWHLRKLWHLSSRFNLPLEPIRPFSSISVMERNSGS